MTGIRYWTPEWIIDACHEWVSLYGQPPKASQWEGHGNRRFPCMTTVQAKFGTWSAMLAAAGYTPRDKKTATLVWTPDMILAACKGWAQQNGRPPAASDWRLVGSYHPSTKTVLRRFGSWNAMIAAAGFEPRNEGAVCHWTKDAIAMAMLDWLGRTGDWPSCRAWRVPRPNVNPAHSTVFRTFGSWNAAKRYAGWDGSTRRERRLRVVEAKCVGCGCDLDTFVIGCRSCMDRRRTRERAAARRGKNGVSLCAVESLLTPGDSGASADGETARDAPLTFSSLTQTAA